MMTASYPSFISGSQTWGWSVVVVLWTLTPPWIWTGPTPCHLMTRNSFSSVCPTRNRAMVSTAHLVYFHRAHWNGNVHRLIFVSSLIWPHTAHCNDRMCTTLLILWCSARIIKRGWDSVIIETVRKWLSHYQWETNCIVISSIVSQWGLWPILILFF